VINLILRNLRFCSYHADAERVSSGEKARYVVQCQEMLRRYLQKMVVDRSSPSVNKKQGCLFIIIHLFKIYFRMNNLKMCSPLIKMMKMLPVLSTYPIAHQVAYQYYYGRLMVFEEQYELALTALNQAFLHCHKDSISNKRRILYFLIPVSLLHSRFPQAALLEKYQLSSFSSLITALHQGNLQLFHRSLEVNQEFWIAKGIYLLLEKLKVTVYRNFFRHVYFSVYLNQIEGNEGKEKERFQLPLNLLLNCMEVLGVKMEMEELECVLANLIYQQQIKGYIAHQRCVVLSKQDPFPKLQYQPQI